MPEPIKLSRAMACRIAVAAQGLDRARPARPARTHVERVIARLGVLQIDAVNVVARAHYMPLFSRLGAYDTAALDAAWLGKKRSCFEYWGHEASILPYDAHHLFRWRMARVASGEGRKHWTAYQKADQGFLDSVIAELRDRGPLSASELSEAGERKGPWWGWSEGKLAMEYLFMVGRVTTHSRRGFERIYDLPERVHPAHVVEAPTPDPQDAVRELARRALCAMGVATSADIADYYRLPPERMKQAMNELVEMGAALRASVPHWKNAAFLDPNARMPRRVSAAALLSPFDPLVWRRERVARIFGFDYRIEIYVPQEKRTFGYYVLPFLLNDALVARVDLKADRAASTLLVQAAHIEPEADEKAVAPALAAELQAMRVWLALERIKVVRKGALAGSLARALA